MIDYRDYKKLFVHVDLGSFFLAKGARQPIYGGKKYPDPIIRSEDGSAVFEGFPVVLTSKRDHGFVPCYSLNYDVLIGGHEFVVLGPFADTGEFLSALNLPGATFLHPEYLYVWDSQVRGYHSDG